MILDDENNWKNRLFPFRTHWETTFIEEEDGVIVCVAHCLVLTDYVSVTYQAGVFSVGESTSENAQDISKHRVNLAIERLLTHACIPCDVFQEAKEECPMMPYADFFRMFLYRFDEMYESGMYEGNTDLFPIKHLSSADD